MERPDREFEKFIVKNAPPPHSRGMQSAAIDEPRLNVFFLSLVQLRLQILEHRSERLHQFLVEASDCHADTLQLRGAALVAAGPFYSERLWTRVFLFAWGVFWHG